MKSQLPVLAMLLSREALNKGFPKAGKTVQPGGALQGRDPAVNLEPCVHLGAARSRSKKKRFG